MIQDEVETGTCPLPVLRRVGQRDHDVLVDEDEEGEQEAEAHGAHHVQGRQALKRSHLENGPVVNFKHGNCSEREEINEVTHSLSPTDCTWNYR